MKVQFGKDHVLWIVKDWNPLEAKYAGTYSFFDSPEVINTIQQATCEKVIIISEELLSELKKHFKTVATY